MHRVAVLGSGTGVPWRGRSAPGVAIDVESDETRPAAILIDPGAGAIHRMAHAGIGLERLRHVLFTHFHPDHVGDLVPLLFALKNPELRDISVLPALHGPRGLQSLYLKLVDVFGSWIDHGARLQIHEIDPPAGDGTPTFVRVGGFEVTAFATQHTEESVAYRFERRDGRHLSIFTYTGDTDYCPGVIHAARNTDMLLIECSFPEGSKKPGHLVPSEVGKIAAAAGAKRVVMTHMYPECHGADLITPCRQYYRGPVELATDGAIFSLCE